MRFSLDKKNFYLFKNKIYYLVRNAVGVGSRYIL